MLATDGDRQRGDERNIDPTELKQNVNRDKSGVREGRKRKEEKKRIDRDDEEEKEEEARTLVSIKFVIATRIVLAASILEPLPCMYNFDTLSRIILVFSRSIPRTVARGGGRSDDDNVERRDEEQRVS